MDGTGIKARCKGEWHARKHGGAKRRVRRKVYLAIDEATMDVRAVEVTDSSVGDAPMLPDLQALQARAPSSTNPTPHLSNSLPRSRGEVGTLMGMGIEP